MYRVYFFNAQGKYQVPIYQEDMRACLELVFTYKDLVPGIRVTQSDEVVFETERGAVLWPDIDAAAVEAIEGNFPPAAEQATLGLMPKYLDSVQRARSADASEFELASSLLRAAELPLLANAAREALNLLEYGYRPVEVVLTEIEEADLAGG
jgi:hypothetical protein